MARYIDADKVMDEINRIGGHNLCEWETIGVKALIDRQPTADVVPKSEFEGLIYKLECLLCLVTGGVLSKHTYDLRTMETVATDCINETYNDGYGEGYKDCAREIFEEIYEECFDQYGYINYEALAELKKKYTEGKV